MKTGNQDESFDGLRLMTVFIRKGLEAQEGV